MEVLVLSLTDSVAGQDFFDVPHATDALNVAQCENDIERSFQFRHKHQSSKRIPGRDVPGGKVISNAGLEQVARPGPTRCRSGSWGGGRHPDGEDGRWIVRPHVQDQSAGDVRSPATPGTLGQPKNPWRRRFSTLEQSRTPVGASPRAAGLGEDPIHEGVLHAAAEHPATEQKRVQRPTRDLPLLITHQSRGSIIAKFVFHADQPKPGRLDCLGGSGGRFRCIVEECS
jgi:hypothetical protein